ncbi:MAG: hypothetical protein JWM32_3047 [Verrucomicrobia bacterium]|nr:hypothetical protein [Verrucomicrobiota bacterium]
MKSVRTFCRSAILTVALMWLAALTAQAVAPVNSMPGAQSVNEDTVGGIVFSPGNGNAISVSDVDSPTITMQLALTAGSFTLATTNNLTLSSGNNGSGFMTYSGTLSALNAALNGLRFNLPANYVGTATFTFSCYDENNALAQNAIGITVNSVEDLPVFVGATTTLATFQNATAVAVDDILHVSDPDAGQTITWSQFSAPTHGVLSFAGGSPGTTSRASGSTDVAPSAPITYTPAAGFFGADSFTVQATDGNSTTTRTITVTVAKTDAVQVANSTGVSSLIAGYVGQSFTLPAGVTQSLVGFNFIDPAGGNPPSGAGTAYLFSSAYTDAPGGLASAGALATGPWNGATGRYEFGGYPLQPSTKYWIYSDSPVDVLSDAADVYGAGESYGAADSSSSFAAQSGDVRFQVWVAYIDVTPTFVGAVTSLGVNRSSGNTSVVSLLHASDIDIGQTLTWSRTTAPSHGTLSFAGGAPGVTTAASGSTDITPGGTITYAPVSNYLGSDSFTVKVSDGITSATRTITVIVDTIPTFSGVSTLTVLQNASAASIVSLLRVSDSDNAQPLAWSQNTAPAHGSLSFGGGSPGTVLGATPASGLTPGGTITYTPSAGYAGTDSFIVQVSDGFRPATKTITVSVTPLAPGPPDLAASSDSGVSTDNLTAATSLDFSGTSATGDSTSTVRVFLDKNASNTYDVGDPSVTTTAGAGGTWSVTGLSTSGVSDGTYNIRAVVTSAIGNLTGPLSTALSITLDTVAPTTTIATVAFSADTGASSSDFITATAAQTLSGLLSANMVAGNLVQVSLDNGVTWFTATTTVGANTWSLSGQTLTGSGTLRVRVTDAAGNSGTSFSQAYVLDTTAPTTTIATAVFSGDTGASATDFVTATAAQSISGTLSANLLLGELVEVSLDNGATWMTASTSVGANTWSLAGQTLVSSDTLRVRVKDVASNAGATLSQPYIFDFSAPAAPTAVTLSPVGGTLVANTLNRTNTNLTATATIMPGQATGGRAELYIGASVVAADSSIAGGDSTVTFDLGATTAGALQAAIASGGVASVKLYDLSGNSATSTVANPTLVIDYLAPTAPTAVTLGPIGGTVVTNTLNGTNTNLTAAAGIVAADAAGGSAGLYVGASLIATDALIGGTDTTVTFDLGTTTTATLQAAVLTGGVVTVRLEDAAGNASISSAGNPTLVVDYVASTVATISGPAAAAYGLGANLDFTINFSEAVTVSGAPNLEILIGGTTRTAVYLSGSGTMQLVFRYVVQASDYAPSGDVVVSALALNGGTISDANATLAVLTFSAPTLTGIAVDARFHSADSNHDSKLGLLELLRVIDLYNTRAGTTRTGDYHEDSATADGFAPGTGARSHDHSADYDHDGKIGLLELLRVIDLYNTRSSTTRTGDYHIQGGTVDGFAPGP